MRFVAIWRCHQVANPEESRNRCIDSKKLAIWFQLGMSWDESPSGILPPPLSLLATAIAVAAPNPGGDESQFRERFAHTRLPVCRSLLAPSRFGDLTSQNWGNRCR